ncbi:MAG: oligogalacturonate lyase family protein [Anaerolineaceae bacterium]|nr:oligogalacturonate lyase family protein [Anaerolineaceae bacterium]
MGVGKEFRDKQVRYQDRLSGREITRLTGWMAHSWQFYFTHPCWIDGGRAFLFHSERDNAGNYFRYELATGAIVQLTDNQGEVFFNSCLAPATECFYHWNGNTLQELDLNTLQERPVYEAEAPFLPRGHGSQISATADGRHVVTILEGQPNVDDAVEQGAGYDPGFRSPFFDPPLSRLVRIDVASGEAQVLREERRYITHLNTSPTRPDLMTYCHEGPWHLIEERIHGLNVETGEEWNIRPQHGEYSVIAEHWFADGETIGFRSHNRAANDTRFGCIRYDNSGHVETVLPYSRHFHSLDGSLVVGDGMPVYLLPGMLNTTVTWPCILLHEREGGGQGWGPARVLAYHGSSFSGQRCHPHPHITPDGQHVLFTTNMSDYSNIYLAPIGDVGDLPLLDLETGGV